MLMNTWIALKIHEKALAAGAVRGPDPTGGAYNAP
jgi:hypothetical protein